LATVLSNAEMDNDSFFPVHPCMNNKIPFREGYRGKYPMKGSRVKNNIKKHTNRSPLFGNLYTCLTISNCN